MLKNTYKNKITKKFNSKELLKSKLRQLALLEYERYLLLKCKMQ